MYHGVAIVGKRFSEILRSIDSTQVAVKAAACRPRVAHSNTFRDRSIEVRVIQGAQELDNVALTPSPHVQPPRQRVNLIAAHLHGHVASAHGLLVLHHG